DGKPCYCGYHSSQSSSAFWSAVPIDVGPNLALVSQHEVQEAALDPADDNAGGWDEAADGCKTTVAQVNKPFGLVGIADNSQNGTCSTTGYDEQSEIQVYGWTYPDYRKKYDELWPLGWRLYILQSYVVNNQIYYNAVWRKWMGGEFQLYNGTPSEVKARSNSLGDSWQLYILQPFVYQGAVRYNAVWRPAGKVGQSAMFDATYADYRANYDSIWPKNWRLQSLQSYALGGQARYSAVWRWGSVPEIQVYGWAYADY